MRNGPKAYQIDLQLARSRDGIAWQRHPERPVFLETGVPGSYDWGMVFAIQGLVDRGDRTYLYYTGDAAFHLSKDVKEGKIGQLCLATLRRDGFVSLNAPDEGYMLTKPLRCPGGRLHVNARMQPGGALRVAVRRADGDRDGDWVAGWGFDEGPVLRGDAVDAGLTWKGQESFGPLAGKSVRLHFWLQKAELYSFWFE